MIRWLSTAVKVAITNTASGTGSKLLDLLAGSAGATSIFNFTSAGTMNWGVNTPQLTMGDGTNTAMTYSIDASTGVTWMIIAAAVGGILVIAFKTSGRSHLD
jgi:hypothetical protein